MGKLTDLKVRNLKPLDKDKAYCDGQGLYIRVRKSGSKKWIIHRKQAGKTIITTIGEYPGTSLKEARYKAADRWIVEAHISKNEQPHWVCLTDSVLEQLPLPKFFDNCFGAIS